MNSIVAARVAIGVIARVLLVPLRIRLNHFTKSDSSQAQQGLLSPVKPIKHKSKKSNRESRRASDQRNDVQGARCNAPLFGHQMFSVERQIRMTNQKTQDEPQWIVAQRLLSALTVPGFK